MQLPHHTAQCLVCVSLYVLQGLVRHRLTGIKSRPQAQGCGSGSTAQHELVSKPVPSAKTLISDDAKVRFFLSTQSALILSFHKETPPPFYRGQKPVRPAPPRPSASFG